ncbi:CLUMA_CG008478, isoform A [Clunio marinus]|uniref:CLUMA_CG008478, isoform A n=1 Tax=Clunio marinus TaxID=568069 RepID=A0A1J1I3S4_9DIPT|nr:CLUMA_CG008478, isoform A [Clunio marinus]
MNQQTRDMNSFLAEQAMLLANNSVSLTQISRPVSIPTNNSNKQNIQNQPSPISTPTPMQSSSPASSSTSNLSKYSQLLLVLEEMGKDIRPTYSGSRSSAERLKRTIVHARILVRECLLETERQQSGRP